MTVRTLAIDLRRSWLVEAHTLAGCSLLSPTMCDGCGGKFSRRMFETLDQCVVLGWTRYSNEKRFQGTHIFVSLEADPPAIFCVRS